MTKKKKEHGFKIGDTVEILTDEGYPTGEKGLVIKIGKTKYSQDHIHVYVPETDQYWPFFSCMLKFIKRDKKDYKSALKYERRFLCTQRKYYSSLVDKYELDIAKVDAILDDL